MSEALFFFLVLALAAAYPVVLYPLLVRALARLRPQPWKEGAMGLPVLHVITVHNEEQRIKRKLENALALKPPPGGVRTVVVNDGSTDQTEGIVDHYFERGVERIDCPWVGKERAQIEAIRSSSEPILVFSDASAMLQPDALEALVRPFADPRVGAVSGFDRLEELLGPTGEGLYVDYEMRLRRDESLAGSVVGLSGCLFAVRREIAQRLVPDVPSDMGSALVAMEYGKRAVLQERAVCRYSAASGMEREFARKRRTALRGLRCLFAYPRALTASSAIVAWQLLSHKWLRFLSPFFAIGAGAVLVASARAGAPWASVLLPAAGVGLACAVATLAIPGLRRIVVLRALAFALLSNLAVLAAWFDLARGRSHVQWSPTSRPEVPQ
jgi:hypothetical protein